MEIEVPHNLADVAHRRGGFADVLKCEHRRREVAVKVLRIYSNSNLGKITRVSHPWPVLFHPVTRSPCRDSARR